MATDYEQKYKEVLEWARKNTARLNGAPIEEVLPELAESEDERMIREIKRYIKEQGDNPNGLPNGTVSVSDMIAWLEKQKEQKPVVTHGETYHVDTLGTQQVIAGKMPQKPAEWSDEDETALGDLMWCIEQARKSAKDENDMGNIWFAENWVNNRLKSLSPQPKQEWSEEDEIYLQDALWCVEKAEKSCKDEEDKGACWSAKKWLKSLRPHWKPSEEQMEAFSSYIKDFQEKAEAAVGGWNNFDVMIRLYEQLKKL